MKNQNKSINYIELPLVDKVATMDFYSTLFGWEFTEWGEGYISFSGAGIDGGFNGVDDDVTPARPGILVVLYVDDLKKMFDELVAKGAEILQPIYAFPGGERFHFKDPNGNELAIWSEPAEAGD